MQFKFGLTFIFCIIVVLSQVNAGNLRNKNARYINQLVQLKEKGSNYDALISTLQLNLQSGGKIDEVITYLQEAIQGTSNDRENLSSEFSSEMERYDQEIAQQTNDINSMNIELSETVLLIKDLAQSIVNLKFEKESIEIELQQLDRREQNIETARDNDVQAFQRRQERDTRSINALNEIIPLLRDLLNGSQALAQKSQEELTEYIQKKEVSQSIKNLVQVSMKFNRAKLTTVIEKLEDLQEAAVRAKEIDEQNEVASEQRYTQLLAELDNLRTQKTQQLAQVKNSISAKESELQQAKANKIRLENNIETTTRLRATTIDTQEAERQSFTRRLNEADQALQALRDALQILQDNSDAFDQVEE